MLIFFKLIGLIKGRDFFLLIFFKFVRLDKGKVFLINCLQTCRLDEMKGFYSIFFKYVVKMVSL